MRRLRGRKVLDQGELSDDDQRGCADRGFRYDRRTRACGRRRQSEVDRQRIPALDAVEGRPVEGAAVVRKGRRSPSRAWKSTSCRKPSRRMSMNRRTLAKAFTEITGIKVKHDLIQEGDVVEKLQTQMQSGKNVYDGWINDSDLIGTHFRYGQTVILSDYMTGEGKDVTNPAARRQRLHRQVLHHGSGRQALSASRPAVREPLLVPLRLVLQSGLQGQVQGQVWLRSRRSRELVGL